MWIKHRNRPRHRNDIPGFLFPSPKPNRPLVVRMPLLAGSPPGPTAPNYRWLASPHASRLLLGMHLDAGSLAQRAMKHCSAFPGYPQSDRQYHCPHPHVSLGQCASLGLDRWSRLMYGRAAMCSSFPKVPEVPWRHWSLEDGCCKLDASLLQTLTGDGGLLCSPCSAEGGPNPAEKLG